MSLRYLFIVCSIFWLAGCVTWPSKPESSWPRSSATPSSTKTPSTAKTAPRTTAEKALSTSKETTSNVATPTAETLPEITEELILDLEIDYNLSINHDLWHRIRKGFAMPDLQDKYVEIQEQWYSARPEYINRMINRSSKYLFHIVEEIEARGMPMELALLPYIESAFNPQAMSSAKAAGMWQFMPATGSYFELTQNAFRDDRRDVLASTKAALDYLQKLYGMFNDWHLALAAYNWGEGSVSKAIKRNTSKGLGHSYIDLNMPQETRNYVPKLQAVKNIIAFPEKFNIELPYIENHPHFQVVDIDRDMDVELVARLADVRLEDFKALNPSFNKPTIFAAGITKILLPWDNAKVFQRNLEAYKDDQYASWTVWIAPSTMSVAQAAKRVGMSEADLRSVNRIPPRMRIQAGSALVVPRDANDRDVATHIADNGKILFAPEVSNVTRRATVQVRKNDTLSQIAKRNGVSVRDLAKWNRISTTSKLKIGQSLQIYRPVRVTAKNLDSTKTSAATKANTTSRRTTVTVRKNDTLSTIAKRNGVSVQDLAKWNRISTTSKLKIGQPLRLN